MSAEAWRRCGSGVALSASPAGFVWQAWRFHYLHRCPRKLGHEVGQIDAAAFRVTDLALAASPAGFVWQAWHFHYLHGCPRKLGDEVGQIDAAAFCVTGVAHLRLDLCGRRGTFTTSIEAWRRSG